jgi:hypothetical protein
MKTNTTSKARAESLRKYLEDCKTMDFSKAFNLHKERMKVVELKRAA